MKRLVFFSLFLAGTTLFTACHKHAIRGEGSVVSETRTLADFTSVHANGSSDIEVYPSTTNKVVVTGYQNLVPVYHTKVNNGILSLEYDEEYINVKHDNIRVQVYTTAMNNLDVNGSAKTTIHTAMTSPSMRININGSGDVYMEQNHFDLLTYKVNGSGNIHGRDAAGEEVNATISGSGDIDVTVNRKLDAKISGSGTIDYWGDPAEVNTDISGSGKVRKNP